MSLAWLLLIVWICLSGFASHIRKQQADQRITRRRAVLYVAALSVLCAAIVFWALYPIGLAPSIAGDQLQEGMLRTVEENIAAGKMIAKPNDSNSVSVTSSTLLYDSNFCALTGAMEFDDREYTYYAIAKKVPLIDVWLYDNEHDWIADGANLFPFHVKIDRTSDALFHYRFQFERDRLTVTRRLNGSFLLICGILTGGEIWKRRRDRARRNAAPPEA